MKPFTSLNKAETWARKQNAGAHSILWKYAGTVERMSSYAWQETTFKTGRTRRNYVVFAAHEYIKHFLRK